MLRKTVHKILYGSQLLQPITIAPLLITHSSSPEERWVRHCFDICKLNTPRNLIQNLCHFRGSYLQEIKGQSLLQNWYL